MLRVLRIAPRSPLSGRMRVIDDMRALPGIVNGED